MLRPLFYLILLAKDDFPRIRTLLFVGLGNLLPDTFFFSRIRVYLLFLAGAKFSNPHTCIVRKGFFTEFAKNLRFGDFVQINRDCIISGHAKTEIGNHTFLSYGVKILSISHYGKNNDQDKIEEIIIGERVMIYAGTVIGQGARICDDCVIGANSVVSGHLSRPGTYLGIPVRLVSGKINE